MLTSKQHELLLFINKRLNESGVSPSFDEMREALDLKSKSGVHRLISALEERGFIRRLPNRARALEVLKLPEFGRSYCVCAATRRSGSRQRHDRDPAAWPYRRRHADRGAPGHRRLRGSGRTARAGRALCARGVGRFDGRGRHSRRRLRADPQGRYGPRRRDRRCAHRQ